MRHSDGASVPLGATVDDDVFKVLFLDTGLAQTAMGMPPMPMDEFRQGRFVNVPIEVKSGAAGSMRSLHQFMALRGANLAVRFDLNPPALQNVSTIVETPQGRKQVDYRLLALPLYLAQWLEPILAGLDFETR